MHPHLFIHPSTSIPLPLYIPFPCTPFLYTPFLYTSLVRTLPYTPHATEHEAWVCPRCTKLRSAVHNPSQAKTTLIICPGSILHQWEAEIQRHTVPGALSVCAVWCVCVVHLCCVCCSSVRCVLFICAVCVVHLYGIVYTPPLPSLPPFPLSLPLSLSRIHPPPLPPPPPPPQVLVYLGQPQSAEHSHLVTTAGDLAQHDIVLTTYEVLRQELHKHQAQEAAGQARGRRTAQRYQVCVCVWVGVGGWVAVMMYAWWMWMCTRMCM